MRLLRCISTFALLAVTTPASLVGQSSQTVSRAEARKAIQDGNIAWGKARVAIDKSAFEKMLAPDLYVQLADRRLTRQQFIDRISSYPPGITLTRLNASVLTVEPNGDNWVAIIQEKIEFDHTGSDGKTEKEYAAWITRDGWRKVSSDKWLILFSEEVGQEHWKGTPPPLANW
jgi:hypothetical protein